MLEIPNPRGGRSSNQKIHISFENYLKADEALRSILTLKDIVPRALLKAAGTSPVSQVYFDTPLRIIQILLNNAKKVILPLGKRRNIIIGD